MNETNIREIARLEIILDVVNAALNRAEREYYQTTLGPPTIVDKKEYVDKIFVINKKGGAVFVNETKIEKYKDKEFIPEDILNSKEYKKFIEDGTLEEVDKLGLEKFLSSLPKENLIEDPELGFVNTKLNDCENLINSGFLKNIILVKKELCEPAKPLSGIFDPYDNLINYKKPTNKTNIKSTKKPLKRTKGDKKNERK